MIFAPREMYDRKDIRIMDLDEWICDYCASGDKISVIVSNDGGVTIKCLVNITSGHTFIVGEL